MISDSTAKTNVAVWLNSYSLLTQKFANPTRLQLPSNVSIKLFILQNQSAYVISSDGEVYTWGCSMSSRKTEGAYFIKTLSFLQTPPVKLTRMLNIRIASIACNDDVSLFLSEDGTVYSYGNDAASKFGLLGLGEIFVQNTPNAINTLFDYRIKTIAMGYSHACAVNSAGLMFTWGTGKKGQLGIAGVERTNTPKPVNSTKALKPKTVVCSYNYTAVLSGNIIAFSAMKNHYIHNNRGRKSIHIWNIEEFNIVLHEEYHTVGKYRSIERTYK